MLNLKNMKIKKRLSVSFSLVLGIASIAAIVGCVAMLVISSRYSHALTYYGFAQGDIGKALTAFAETRSSLRAVIGYDREEDVQKVMNIHDEKKERFEGYMKDVKTSIITEEVEVAYNEVISKLDEYWKMDAEILSIGAFANDEQKLKAQDMISMNL